MHILEAYGEPRQKLKMELFVKIVNGWKPSTIFIRSSIFYVLYVCMFDMVLYTPVKFGESEMLKKRISFFLNNF